MSMSKFASKDDYYVSKIQERDKAIVGLQAKCDALEKVVKAQAEYIRMPLSQEANHMAEARKAHQALLKEQADND